MYIKSSSPRVERDNAILMSPTYKYPINSQKCVEFWYHAYGKNVIKKFFKKIFKFFVITRS